MVATVLLVDDTPEVRDRIRAELESRLAVRVVAEASDGDDAVVAARATRPDVIVLDLDLADLAGHEVLSRLRTATPASRIVVLSGSGHGTDDDDVAADIEFLVEAVDALRKRARRAASIRLNPLPTSSGVARRFVGSCCEAWGVGAVADNASLVASELVTNAIVHTARPCVLSVRVGRGGLRLEVTDAGMGVPDLMAATDEDDHGRGLVIVSALSAAWGVDSGPADGKVVWAELPATRAASTRR